MSTKQVIKTSNAPNPVGPYNQAIKAGDFIYCSGQIAIDPALNEITCLGDIEKETIQVLKNLEEALGKVTVKNKTSDAFISNQNENLKQLNRESNVTF